MRLAKDRFYKGTFNYRKEADGPLESAPCYSYESADRLYDVIILPNGELFTRTNCRPSEFTRIHRAIVEHFNLKGVR